MFRASVGNDPSIADVIKLARPKPRTASRAVLYGYLIGRAHDADALPPLVKEFEACKANRQSGVPDVPFRMLMGLPLTKADWTTIAENGGWTMTRMNLNTFARHGVFDSPRVTALVADRLRSPELIRKARAFPYQLLAAFTSVGPDVPGVVKDALQDAMELAIGNVPAMAGKVYVFPDVSGSMHSPVTGVRRGSTTAVRCVDVAGLVAAAVLRRNPTAQVIPFSTDVVECDLNGRDSVITNAKKLASFPPGGTNCSAPLRLLNERKATGDVVIYVSDNESWIDSTGRGWAGGGGATETLKQWEAFKRRSPQAKLACIDLQPYGTTQAAERADVLNVGGFSDAVFDLLAEFAAGTLAADHWVGVIESVELGGSNEAPKEELMNVN